MNAVVVRFPGSNCDEDVKDALERLGARVRFVWHQASELGRADAVVLPGGFSYGDYLRGGALAAQSPVMAAVRRFAARGGTVLGICNGFQILTEAGLLPGQLARNAAQRFICARLTLRIERSDTRFTRGYAAGQVITLPVAHGEGRYYADDDTLERLEGEGRVVLRYCDARGALTEAANPNGSRGGVAGILNESGNVLGMMPHPERAAEPLLGGADGAPLLAALLSG